MVVAAGLVATAPVWLWNLQHDFASIRFQSSHGLGGLSFMPSAALRTWLGQAVMLSPVAAYIMIAYVVGRCRKGRALLKEPSVLAVAGFLPLALLLTAIAPFKQSLPHWILPAFWVLIPFVSIARPGWRAESRAWRINFIGAAALVFLLPWVLALPVARTRILASLAGDPGPLAELTLWPGLAHVLETSDVTSAGVTYAPAASHCPQTPALASLRWFWAAQLRFHLSAHPRIYSLDPNHRSYYDYRDAGPPHGCPIVIVTDMAHIDATKLSRRIQILSTQRLVVPYHEHMRIAVLHGIVR